MHQGVWLFRRDTEFSKMKKEMIFFIFGILILTGSLIPLAKSVGEISFCCEKTNEGVSCINEPETKCSTAINPLTNSPYRKAPTSCEATTYCKEGTCINVQEGECMKNTPQVVCNKNGGFWDSRDAEDIPQCSLGCCLVGDQAAYVTQTRCKRLSGIYGLETNFRTDIQNEVECIATTTSSEKGACVYEKDFVKTCKLTTQKECNDMQEESEFHAGFLCTAQELETNCAPDLKKTICSDKDDSIHFLDTCGNIANIYDESKKSNNEYWTKIKERDESCNPGSSNAGSATCGSCDYYLDVGSTCKPYDKSIDKNKPRTGDYICRDLSCTYEGKKYNHGETWCASNSKIDNTLPGSENFRLVCYNSEVTIEQCASYRGEVCVQEEVNDVSNAACRINRWQDCVAVGDQKDCENTDKRDCKWINSGNKKDDNPIYVCVPKYSPGFDFWNAESEAKDICKIASLTCTAVFKNAPIGGGKWDCKENCGCCVNDDDHQGCTGERYIDYKNNICSALGDCGAKTNYAGSKGYFSVSNQIQCTGGPCREQLKRWLNQ